MPDQPDAATAAVRAMIAQWVSLSTAVAEQTLGPAGSVPPPLAATLARVLGTVNVASRDDVLALGAAVATLDARLARIEAALIADAARSGGSQPRSTTMADLSHVKEHMNVIGADGVHVGTVDKVEGGRIKLTKDSSTHTDHHHFISGGLVAEVEGNDVRLSANGDVAVTFEEEA